MWLVAPRLTTKRSISLKWRHMSFECLLNSLFRTDNKRKHQSPALLALHWGESTETGGSPLTHWGRHKMAAVSQTTLSNAFSWMKMLEFRLRFHWSLFPRVQLIIIQHWFRYWLGAVQATSHYLNQWWLVYWRIYASLGPNELKRSSNAETMSTSWRHHVASKSTILHHKWISNYIHYKMWDGITYPFTNFNGCAVGVGNG